MKKSKIPSQEEKNDFIIIYKGIEDDNGEIIEKIDEIRTSKHLLIKSLRYFDEKKDELQNEISIHDVYPNSIFKKFIESIQTKNIRLADEKTCMQYYDLSQKYGYEELTNLIKKRIDKRYQLTKTIEQLSNEISSNDPIDTEKEEILSKHLDFCIENLNLKKLPIHMIIRIINSPKRVLNNHHLLFQFVKEMIDFIEENDTKNSQYIPLFISSLDFNQMNVEEIKSLLNDGFKCLLDEIKIKDEKINSLEFKIDNMQKKLDKQNDFNNQFKLQLDSLNNNQLQFEENQKQQFKLYKRKLNKIQLELDDFKELKNEKVEKQFKINQQEQKEEINNGNKEIKEGYTVFIRNIPYSTTAKELSSFLYQQFGEINNVRILQERCLGQSCSRGIGFVEFKTQDSYQKALCAQNVEFKTENGSRRLVILQTRSNRKHDTVHIIGIPPDTRNVDIFDAFKQVKPIKIRIIRYDNERSLGFACAKFSSENNLYNAIQNNRTININQSKYNSKVYVTHTNSYEQEGRRRFSGRRRFWRRLSPKFV